MRPFLSGDIICRAGPVACLTTVPGHVGRVFDRRVAETPASGRNPLSGSPSVTMTVPPSMPSTGNARLPGHTGKPRKHPARNTGLPADFPLYFSYSGKRCVHHLAGMLAPRKSVSPLSTGPGAASQPRTPVSRAYPHHARAPAPLTGPLA